MKRGSRFGGYIHGDMIEPSPTTKIDPHLARGVLEAVVPDTATRQGYIVLRVPNTSYQLQLRPTSPLTTPVGKRIVGRIKAQARRVDVVGTGGRYVEPVSGHPRRIQGMIVDADAGSNSITVNAGVPIVCAVTEKRQQAGQFEPGQFVTFDVLEGATFTPEG